jgi:hypothetical protein
LNQLICEATFWNDSVTFYQTLQEIDFLKATKKQYQRSHFILENMPKTLEEQQRSCVFRTSGKGCSRLRLPLGEG